MTSVFKRLISRELGEAKYNKYFICYQKLILDKKYDSRNFDNKEIYEDIYNNLKDKDAVILKSMLERLLDTMCLALKISKTYFIAFIVYLTASGFLIFQGMIPLITIVGLVAMSFCFIYKTYEFVVNKYCYIDAHIILVYKSVLDRLLLLNPDRTTD